jgi:hypothetical protein
MEYERTSINTQGKKQCMIIYYIWEIIYELNFDESIITKKDGDDNKEGDNMKNFQKI